MFSGFYVNLDSENRKIKDFVECYRECGIHHLEEERKKYDATLKKYLREETLSAKLIEGDWFPNIKADVFLSHSRGDKEIVEAFAGWLNRTFGLRCFLDSNVWNHADSLLEILNQKYSDPEQERNVTYYSYPKCLKVSEHVNMILSVALQKMIDRAEAIFMVNAGNFAQLGVDTKLSETYSPWIYLEVSCANMISKKPLIFYRSYPMKSEQRRRRRRLGVMQFLMESLRISYPLNLKSMEQLTIKELCNWKRDFTNYQKLHENSYRYPLDFLYQMTKYKSALQYTKDFSKKFSSENLDTIRSCISSPMDEKNMMVLMESLEFECKKLFRCPKEYGLRCCETED